MSKAIIAPSGKTSTTGIDRFLELNKEEADLFLRKNAGYAGVDNPDPWANFRHAEKMGLLASTGVLVRMSDKMSRLYSLTRRPDNEQVGESKIDTARDLAVYCKIFICLLEDEANIPELQA